MKAKLTDFSKIFNGEKEITNPTHIDNNMKFTEDGIFSELIFPEEQSIDELGWISFNNNYIINPIMYNYIQKLFGKKKLEKILNYEKSIDKDGNQIETEDEIEDQNTGLIKFKDNFIALMKKHANKSKYPNEYDFVMKNHAYVFIKEFPVFNFRLRPAMVLDKTVSILAINNYYNFLIKYSNELKEENFVDENENPDNLDVIKLPILFSMQYYANTIFNSIINDYLKGKKGFLRKSTLGSRLNNSARMVITPLFGYQLDEIAIPYRVFAELYKYQLINIISQVKKILPNEALEFWKDARLEFNEELYSYMLELLHKTKDGLTVLVNRNPKRMWGVQ